MEQKLVQRCETKVDADACKASYVHIKVLEKCKHPARPHPFTAFGGDRTLPGQGA